MRLWATHRYFLHSPFATLDAPLTWNTSFRWTKQVTKQIFFQVRNLFRAHGQVAHGGSLDPMSWHATLASIQGPSHSIAHIVENHLRDLIILSHISRSIHIISSIRIWWRQKLSTGCIPDEKRWTQFRSFSVLPLLPPPPLMLCNLLLPLSPVGYALSVA